jgi:hypothetical protein
MIIAPPNPESREIAGALTDLEVRMRRAEAGLRAAQLKNSSITNGGVNIYDGDGRLRGVVGRNPDGTYAPTSTNNPDPPPVPASPIVTPALASLIVRHNGETQSGVQFPSDFSHLNIYYALEQNPDEWTNGGSLLKLPDELPIAPLEYTSYLVAVTAVNLSGKESEKSVPSSGSPNQVVPNDLIEDILADLELSAGQVTEASIAAGAVTETKIAPDSISSPKVIAGAILGVHILADQIDGGKLVAQAITSREIQALAVIAGKIDVNAVTAGTIAVGAVTAVKLEANLIISSRVIAGSATGNRVEMHPTQGLQAYTNGGALRSFWIDAGTGSALLIGEIRSAASGTRIIINPGGNQPDRIQFWPDAAGGSVDYAYIDSFPEGAVDTGITMQASGGATNRVGTIWLRRAYAALGIADNGLVANSHFYAEPNFVRCRSATVDLIVDQAVAPLNGPRRVAILNYNTSGQPVVNSGIYYITATANQYPMLFSPPFGVGIIWDGAGYIAFVNGNTSTYDRVPIEASQFRLASDSRMKSNVSDFEWSALDTIQQSPAKKWKRKNMGVRTAPRDDPMFASATTRSLREEPWLFGPMADDLPPDLIHTDADSGMRKIELGSMIGVLWKAVEELSAKVKELEDVNR